MRVGVDIGATKIEFVVLDKKNKVIFKKRISTPKSYKKVISDIKLFYFLFDLEYLIQESKYHIKNVNQLN